MSYEGIVTKLIRAGVIPEVRRDGRGTVGYAEFDYLDVESDLVVVTWYTDDGEMIEDQEYTKEEIRAMWEEYKSSLKII